MKRGQKTGAEQVVLELRRIEVQTAQGRSLAIACREAEISKQRDSRRRTEYGGLQIDQARRMKELERENARLRWLVAELSLEKQVLADVAAGNLERLIEPSDLVEGDEAGGEAREGLVDVCASLIANGQSTESVEPGVGALHDPTVTTEFLAALNAATGDARHDPARSAFMPAGSGIVGFVGVQLVWTTSRSAAPTAPHRRDGIEGGRHHDGVVPIGTAQAEAERRAARVGDEIALRARLAPVRRIRAGGRALYLAGTDALSRLARLQSISPAACRRSSST